MSGFQPRDPAFADRVTAAFRNESATARWGGRLVSVAPGAVEIKLALSGDLAARREAMRRSIVAALLDDACVLAALSLTSAGDSVTTAEYKLNILDSGWSGTVFARAEVVRPGRSITVCGADATEGSRLVAKSLATLVVSR